MQLESRRSEGAALEADGAVFAAAGDRADGEYRCADCGYGVTVREVLPPCPMCRGRAWVAPSPSMYGRSPV